MVTRFSIMAKFHELVSRTDVLHQIRVPLDKNCMFTSETSVFVPVKEYILVTIFKESYVRAITNDYQAERPDRECCFGKGDLNDRIFERIDTGSCCICRAFAKCLDYLLAIGFLPRSCRDRNSLQNSGVLDFMLRSI